MRDLFDLHDLTIEEINKASQGDKISAEAKRYIAFWMSLDKVGEYFSVICRRDLLIMCNCQVPPTGHLWMFGLLTLEIA